MHTCIDAHMHKRTLQKTYCIDVPVTAQSCVLINYMMHVVMLHKRRLLISLIGYDYVRLIISKDVTYKTRFPEYYTILC